MKLQITIPDELHDKLLLATPKSKSVEYTIVGLLTAFPIDLRERYMLITNDERHEIEKLLSVPVANTKELLKRIATHASVSIGNIRLNPTAQQMAKLESRAKANHRTPQEEAEKVFTQMSPHFIGYI